jgi:hypothetical protein
MSFIKHLRERREWQRRARELIAVDGAATVPDRHNQEERSTDQEWYVATFGCENSQPTFRYSLLDGVKESFLINPTVVDARTEVTTTLLSEEGFVVAFTDDIGEDQHVKRSPGRASLGDSPLVSCRR